MLVFRVIDIDFSPLSCNLCHEVSQGGPTYSLHPSRYDPSIPNSKRPDHQPRRLDHSIKPLGPSTQCSSSYHHLSHHSSLCHSPAEIQVDDGSLCLCVCIFLVDCTSVEMCFNRIIAKQCVLHRCGYLQPIMFNVEDSSQTTIHQTALGCQAPLSRDIFPDLMAREPQLSSTRCVVDSPRQTSPPPSSLYSFSVFVLISLYFSPRVVLSHLQHLGRARFVARL